MTSKNVNIFTASTPLNAVLSAAIARNNDEDNFLFLIDQETHLKDKNLSLFKTLENTIFKKVILISTRKKGYFSFINKRLAIKKLSIETKKIKPSKLWIFNDRRIENQYLIDIAIQNNSEVIYADDGLYSYKIRRWSKNYILFILRKIIYGRWIKQVELIGIADYINKTALLYPKYSIEKLREKENINISKNNFKHVVRKLWDFDCKTIEENSVLMLLPHSSALSEDESEIFKRLIEKHTNNNEAVYIKIHPRDNKLPIKSTKVKVLDGSIPVERYLIDAKFSTLYSGLSTVIITAHWLGLRNVKCYSTKDIRFLDFLGISKV